MLRMLPYRTADNVINGVVMTFTDITRITAAEARIEQLTADLRARIGELETLLDLVPVGVMVAEGSDPPALLVNTYGARLLGGADGYKGFRPSTVPMRLFEGTALLPPAAQPLLVAARTGVAVPDWQGRLEDKAGRSVEVMISATPLFGEAGEVRGAIAAIVDITAHKLAQSRQQMLLHELQHRVKNILATVDALAIRMWRTNSTMEAFHAALFSRLAAMGRVHNLLTTGAWAGAELRALIETALDPYRGETTPEAVLEGPAIRLSPAAATTLGMVFHELATNAAKYGALSGSGAQPGAGGRVHVTWSVADTPAPAVRLVWAESGGPPVAPQPARGFGTGFVERAMDYEMSGTATLDFAPQGLVCTITFPLADNVQPPEWGALESGTA